MVSPFGFSLRRVINERSRRRILPYQHWLGRLVARVVEAHGGCRRVKVNVTLCNLIAVLPQRRNIVENPECAPMRGQNEVVILHHQIVHRCRGQIQLQRTPVRSVVERYIHASFGSRIEQAAFLRVFAHHPNERSSPESPG